MQWVLAYRGAEGVRRQADGLRFSECDPNGIDAVGVQVNGSCVAQMIVPDGGVVEMYWEHTGDIVAGAALDGGLTEALPRLKFGWRIHDGSRREAWLRVGDDGLVESIDPNRAWPEDEGKPNLHD